MALGIPAGNINMVMLSRSDVLRLAGYRQVNSGEVTRVETGNQPPNEILFLAFAADQKDA